MSRYATLSILGSLALILANILLVTRARGDSTYLVLAAALMLITAGLYVGSLVAFRKARRSG